MRRLVTWFVFCGCALLAGETDVPFFWALAAIWGVAAIREDIKHYAGKP